MPEGMIWVTKELSGCPCIFSEDKLCINWWCLTMGIEFIKQYQLNFNATIDSGQLMATEKNIH
jgi:hypothetical protein